MTINYNLEIPNHYNNKFYTIEPNDYPGEITVVVESAIGRLAYVDWHCPNCKTIFAVLRVEIPNDPYDYLYLDSDTNCNMYTTNW